MIEILFSSSDFEITKKKEAEEAGRKREERVGEGKTVLSACPSKLGKR